MNSKFYKVIGLMSGSSLDGIDIAWCQFNLPSKKQDNPLAPFIKGEYGKWSYKILKAITYPYSRQWKERLIQLSAQDIITFLKTDVEYGHYLGKMVKKFIQENNLQKEVDLIASHGHTIFHQPQAHFTAQIGKGAAIAAECGFPVVCDFRSSDVALGGQGAPIVPIGDSHLFSDYAFCLNLGGIANISYQTTPSPPLLRGNKIIAFDICPANQVLNALAKQANLDYDKDGTLAQTGKVQHQLLEQLNALAFYKKKYPKSLSNEWISKTVLPIFDRYNNTIADKLSTACEHIAFQITKTINDLNKQSSKPSPLKKGVRGLLITGGGCFNKFLMKRIQSPLIKGGRGLSSSVKIIIPEEKIIKYKEALIIGFMGVLRIRNEINLLSSVTGATRDSIGGAVIS